MDVLGSRRRKIFALIPLAWMIFFILIPLLLVAITSFARRGIYGNIEWIPSFVNYIRFADSLYLNVILASLKLALITTLECLGIGLPFAYILARASRRSKYSLLLLLMIPFWTNFLVRVFSIRFLFSPEGPLSIWLTKLGWISEPIVGVGTSWLLYYGMLSNYLPLMIVPLFVALEQFDFKLLDAASDLGATRFQVWYRILIPSIKDGFAAAFIFVFVPALGEYVIPELLGGGKQLCLGSLISEQFLKSRNWPFGSAIAMILIMASLIFSRKRKLR